MERISPVDPDKPPDPRPRGEPRPPDPRRALGRLGEHLAAAHLERLGFTILDRNFRTRHGELDLIVCDDNLIAFVEVKTRRVRAGQRKHSLAVLPLEGLGYRQRSRQRRLAGIWLQEHSEQHVRDLRFDAVGVLVDADDRLLRLDHVEGAW